MPELAQPGSKGSERPSSAEPTRIAGALSCDVRWLAAIIAAGLLIRIWLAPHRWVNPDEGAHLMDGRLALDGLIPFVDYDSRQVLYSYILAALLGVSGKTYVSVRMCVAAVDVGVGLVVYAIGRRLWDGRVGIIAALAYTLLPFTISWSTTVHTEPFTNLLVCLGILGIAGRAPKPPGALGLAGSGACFGLAFYVRESSLGVLFAAGVYLVLSSRREPRALLGRVLLFATGFLVPCGVVGAWYGRWLSLSEWWSSRLNPLAIVITNLGGVVGGSGRAGSAQIATLSISPLPRETSLHYLRSVGMMHAGLLLAAALVPVLPVIARGWPQQRPRGPMLLLGCWIGGLMLVYAYWTAHRGFFPQYGEEFLPPLVLLLSFVLLELLAAWGAEGETGTAVVLIGGYLALAFSAAHQSPTFEPPIYMYFVVPALALALAHLPPTARAGGWGLLVAMIAVLALLSSDLFGAPWAVRVSLKLLMVPAMLGGLYALHRAGAPSTRKLPAFAALTVVLTALGYGYAAAGRQLDARYQAVWAPETVATVASHLRARSDPADRVLSGALIWELESNLRPFANVTHPLGFLLRVRPDQSAALTERLDTSPPRFVIMDGYTQRTYGRAVPGLADILAERYSLDTIVAGSTFPVMLYHLR